MKKLLIALIMFGFVAPVHAINWGQFMRYYGLSAHVPLDVTIADSGDGSAAASTLTTPTRRSYRYTCSDTHGCNLTLGETSVFDGQELTIYNVGSNTLNMADSSGVSELNGAYAMAQYSFITLEYQTDQWVEVSRSVTSGTASDVSCTGCVNTTDIANDTITLTDVDETSAFAFTALGATTSTVSFNLTAAIPTGFTLNDTGIAVPFTGAGNQIGVIGPHSDSTGGVRIVARTLGDATALMLQGAIGVDGAIAGSPITFYASKMNGSGDAIAVGNAEEVATFANNGTELVRVLGDGTIDGAVFTGASYRSETSNIASAGILRLANNEGIQWRNAANDANLTLKVDGSDFLTYDGAGLDLNSGEFKYTAADDFLRTSSTTGGGWLGFDTNMTIPFSFASGGRFFAFVQRDATVGGITWQGATTSGNGIALNVEGFSGATAPTIAPVRLHCSKHNGAGGETDLAATEKCISWATSDNELGYFRGDGAVVSPLYATVTNCSDSAGDAACSAAPSGSVVVDAADTATVVSTTAVTANSQIFLQIDASLGTRLSVTCNTQAASVFNPRVTARTAATSFTITVDAGPTTNPLCLSYFIVN